MPVHVVAYKFDMSAFRAIAASPVNGYGRVHISMLYWAFIFILLVLFIFLQPEWYSVALTDQYCFDDDQLFFKDIMKIEMLLYLSCN